MNYNPLRIRNLFLPGTKKPFKLSRSKIQDFLDCPKCFYLDRRCGTGRPGSPPFRLNTAVDTLLKIANVERDNNTTFDPESRLGILKHVFLKGEPLNPNPYRLNQDLDHESKQNS